MSKAGRHTRSIHQKMVDDAVRIGKTMPFIHALVELDITAAKALLRKHRKATGQSISFSAYLFKACAMAIHQSPDIQNMFVNRSSTHTFDEVDFFVPLESLHGNKPVITHKLIRNVQDKTLVELSQIISNAATSPPGLPNRMQTILLKLPWFIRGPIYTLWMKSPSRRKAYFGTTYISSIINYSADRRTWGIPIPMHALGLFIGTTSKRLVKEKDQIEERDMLQLTISVDHRVSNGGDMARFVHRLKHILEHQHLVSKPD